MNNLFILIASNGKGVGKTTFSKELIRQLGYEYKDTNIIQSNFADAVRDDVFYLISQHSDYTQEQLSELYNHIKDKDINYNKNIKAVFQLRTMLNRYSLFLSEFFPDRVWANKYYKNINKKLKANMSNIVIADDLRRYEELEFLKKTQDCQIITVYLSKEIVTEPEEKSFEGLLNSKDFDINLSFTEDWSNFNTVMEEVMSFVAKVKN